MTVAEKLAALERPLQIITKPVPKAERPAAYKKYVPVVRPEPQKRSASGIENFALTMVVILWTTCAIGTLFVTAALLKVSSEYTREIQ